MNAQSYIRWFERLDQDDVPLVGGKNASLGEMVQALRDQGIRVPDGFATTADAYWRFVEAHALAPQIEEHLTAYADGDASLDACSQAIRDLFTAHPLPETLAEEIRTAYRDLSARYDVEAVDVAVRSSATAEDLPEASFAGQQESFLNIRGEEALLDACRACFASLFTSRAIAYREAQGFGHLDVALSIGVQKMVRSDQAGAGVIFTIDTESGFPDLILTTAAWGLGENVVKGTVNPDQYAVFKPLLDREDLTPIIEKQLGTKAQTMIYADDGDAPTRNVDTPEEKQAQFVLSDDEILQLSRWALAIEEHYGRAMDIEWAKDGESGDLFIVQARPETVESRAAAQTLKTYRLTEPGSVLLRGQSIGRAIASGTVVRVHGADELDALGPDAILVASMTDPDWVPAMKQVAGIVTEHGGRTCHAAIVSRELGIPAVVGTETAMTTLDDGQAVTISCAEGATGFVYDGALAFETTEVDLAQVPETDTHVMLNLATPEAALQWWRLPADGIGLARMEFIVGQYIQIHPMALVDPDAVEDEDARARIHEMTRGYDRPTDYFVDRLAQGLARIAASQYPNPVIVRTSDFKTNEYAELIGGRGFEPDEENPMLGWRGASRYYSDAYRDGFALECAGLRKVREAMGFTNIAVMIPFCRTPEEADRVLEEMAKHGLVRGLHGLAVYVMCEVPSNVILAEDFARRFDGFSIGSNDLTQLVLGVDRDSERLAYLFDERNEAVKRMIRTVITEAHAADCVVGICGEAPSNYPEFVDFLVDAGIDSLSVNPDSFLTVKERVAASEARAERPASVS